MAAVLEKNSVVTGIAAYYSWCNTAESVANHLDSYKSDDFDVFVVVVDNRLGQNFGSWHSEEHFVNRVFHTLKPLVHTGLDFVYMLEIVCNVYVFSIVGDAVSLRSCP